MTATELKASEALLKCSFLPGSFDKRFVNQLPNWRYKPMTEKGRSMLFKMIQKYRKQIPSYSNLLSELNYEEVINGNKVNK